MNAKSQKTPSEGTCPHALTLPYPTSWKQSASRKPGALLAANVAVSKGRAGSQHCPGLCAANPQAKHTFLPGSLSTPTQALRQSSTRCCCLEPSAAAPYVGPRQTLMDQGHFQGPIFHCQKSVHLEGREENQAKRHEKSDNQVVFLFHRGSKFPRLSTCKLPLDRKRFSLEPAAEHSSLLQWPHQNPKDSKDGSEPESFPFIME